MRARMESVCGVQLLFTEALPVTITRKRGVRAQGGGVRRWRLLHESCEAARVSRVDAALPSLGRALRRSWFEAPTEGKVWAATRKAPCLSCGVHPAAHLGAI